MSAETTTEAHAGHNRSRPIGDAVRVLAAASIVFSAFRLGLPETLGLTVMLLGLLIPRIARLAGPFDTAFCITIFVATWSGIAGLYGAISWWDLLVHFITVGSSAAVLYLILAKTDVTPGSNTGKSLPARSIVVLIFALGITVAVLWEFIEWAGNAYITKAIHVGYDDTIGDLAVGGLGAILAGVALARWKAR
ncbi:hypothetical protein [Arthrobacter roseus]|uniref:hypothetical protein n=1 Tax=Arthrobacter roseus TaxID=136274 RepID=UPI00196505E0|nr:hypothetical protein [Arthrobacter roseus]MBM7846878.1 hypothetical protein [Arthrobacter roseus]